jgi:hypothetical protein
MKHLTKYSACLIALIAITTISSCDRKSCENTVCGVNEQCYQGQCYCNDGYEGAGCATLSYEKYLGNYYAYETCNNSPANFTTYYPTIFNDPNDERVIYINNLFGEGVQATAYIRTDDNNTGNYFVINSQSFGGFTFSGTGRYDNVLNRINLDLNYTWNFSSYACTHTMLKQ